MLALIAIFFSPVASLAAPQCDPASVSAPTSKEQNARYDDFFKLKREQETRETERLEGRREIREQREYRRVQLERARNEYKRKNKDSSLEEKLRVQWEAEQLKLTKGKLAVEACYADARRKLESQGRGGRQIPGLVEFDLQDY